MKSKKAVRSALGMSVLSIALCAAMLIGTTFAWFTDTATTSVNKIQSGTLDIALEMWNGEKWVSAEGKTLNFLRKNGETLVEDANILWEPGCTYQLPQLRVRNNGNLALKYKVAITGIQGDTGLAKVIKWTYTGEDDQAFNMNAEHKLAAKTTADAPADVFTISAHMQETAGNEYQNKSIENIAITVVATQDTVEFDSTGNDYDKDAIYPLVAAATVNADEDTVLKDKEVDHNVKLTAPAGSVAAETTSLKLTVDTVSTPAGITVSDTQSSQTFEVKLVDQDGNKVTAADEALFTVEMNIGTGRTGLKLYHDGVLMTMGNAEKPDYYVYDSATGYVTMKVSHFSPFTAVFNKGNWSDNAAEDYATPVDETKKAVTITSAEDLALLAQKVNAGTSYKGYTVKLTANIDLEENQWTPIGKSGNTFQGIFDGQGYTISNLIVGDTWKSDMGLFGVTTNGEVKNFTLNNAIVKGYLDVGAVAGTPYTSKYSNITLTGDVRVDGFAYVGGMFGKNAYANLTDLTIDVEDGSYVNAKSGNYRTYVGGLVGFMGEGNQVVKNVTSNIDVTGSTCDVGGITGIAHYGNSFINCKSSGNVTLTSAQDEGDELEIGGIAGVWLNEQGYTVTLTDCSYTGTLSSNNVKTGAVTEFCYNGLVGNKYTRNSDAGTLTIN